MKANQNEQSTTGSPKRLARIAGVLYLLVGISTGFAEGYMEPKLYAAGDAATTAANVVASAAVLRSGVVADLFGAVIWVFLAMVLYRLFRDVNETAARVMVVLVALGAGVMMLNEVFELEALRVAVDGSYRAAFGAVSSHALVLMLLDLQHDGVLIAQVFFGLWLMPLGYLAYRSGWFPKVLGALLIVGGACYLVDLLAAFLVPDLGRAIHAFVVIPSAIAEISMVGYLLVIGAKT